MKFLTLIVLALFMLLSCKKDDTSPDTRNLVNAKVIDYHNTTGCSKGWIIQTDNLTFRAETMPDEQKLKDTMSQKGLPIDILVEFKVSDEQSYCSDIYRKVIRWYLVIASN